MKEIIRFERNKDGNIVKTTCILYAENIGIIAKGFAYAGKKNNIEYNKPNKKRGREIAIGRAYKAMNLSKDLFNKSGKLQTAIFAPRPTEEDSEIINRVNKKDS